MSKDNVTGKDKDFYELGKRMFDRLKPATPIKPIIEQRPWVGLTDEDKLEIKRSVIYDQFETAGEYANRVQALTEAKLKEKNSGHT